MTEEFRWLLNKSNKEIPVIIRINNVSAINYYQWVFEVSFRETSQTFNIMDYYPMQVGIQWRYTNANGELLTIVTIQNTDKDSDGTPMAVFSSTDTSMGLTHKTVYGIRQNKVVALAFQDVFGNNREPIQEIILATPGETWEYGDRRQEYSVCKASKSQIGFDDKSYLDCICVEKTTRYYYDGKWRESRTKTYFAKGIGKVYVEISGEENKEWRTFDKLIQFRGR